VSTWLLGWLGPALARSEPPPADARQQVVERMIGLMRQAQALQAEGKEAEAIPFLEQAVALGEQGLGPEAWPLTIPLERLSDLYRAHGDRARAALLSHRALAIRTRQQVLDEMLSLMQQARALQTEGKDTKAIPLLERAVALGEQGLAPETLPTALALETLALLYRTHDDLARGEPLYQRALAIRENAQGPEHPDVASTLTSLADIALAREEFGRAEALFQRALLIQEHALGPQHTTVATTLYSLGTLSQRQGDYGRAEPLLRRALALKDAPPFLPLICYEIIFPDEAVPKAERPDWLLNVTNDGWFGNSSGPYQHFQQARVRAIEQGLPLVRAANTGISAVVDPFGRILKELPLGAEGVIDSGLPQRLEPTLYLRGGDVLVKILFGFGFLVVIRRRLRSP